MAEGILEWNKAFEKLGYYNAIHVYQPGEYETREEDIDPEDINYNFFRWITAEAGFAMGPSRVNPKTGEILDADIIFDDSFLRYWKQEYEVMTPQTVADLFGHPAGRQNLHEAHGRNRPRPRARRRPPVRLLPGDAAPDGLCRLGPDGPRPDRRQRASFRPNSSTRPSRKSVMHEVGHTLGLRHNFKASAWKDLKQIDDKSKGPNEAIVASVMDYNPGQYRARREHAGLLLHAHDRPLRLLGHRIRLQGALRQRIGGTGQNRRPRHRAGAAIRDRRRRDVLGPTPGRTCSTWVTTRSTSRRGR